MTVTGTLTSARTGAPIAGATVTGEPDTGDTVSDAEGRYTLVGTGIGAGFDELDVRVAKIGFFPAQQRAALSRDGRGTANVSLRPRLDGLSVSPASLSVAPGQLARGVQVSSTRSFSEFVVESSANWLMVSPRSGTSANSSTLTLSVRADPVTAPPEGGEARITVRSAADERASVAVRLLAADEVPVAIADDEEGEDGLDPIPSDEVPATGDTDVPPPNEPAAAPNSGDCRRADILRTSTGDDRLPFLIFPETTVLPGGEGDYTLTTAPLSLYADSFLLNVAGRLTITHTSGGPVTSRALLFSVDRNDVVTEYAETVSVATPTERATLAATLDTGLYCYLLTPPSGVFAGFDRLGLRVTFEPNGAKDRQP